MNAVKYGYKKATITSGTASGSLVTFANIQLDSQYSTVCGILADAATMPRCLVTIKDSGGIIAERMPIVAMQANAASPASDRFAQIDIQARGNTIDLTIEMLETLVADVSIHFSFKYSGKVNC